VPVESRYKFDPKIDNLKIVGIYMRSVLQQQICDQKIPFVFILKINYTIELYYLIILYRVHSKFLMIFLF